jgi:hypothetical protein
MCRVVETAHDLKGLLALALLLVVVGLTLLEWWR